MVQLRSIVIWTASQKPLGMDLESYARDNVVNRDNVKNLSFPTLKNIT